MVDSQTREIRLLRAKIPYLFDENNIAEIRSSISTLEKLGDDPCDIELKLLTLEYKKIGWSEYFNTSYDMIGEHRFDEARETVMKGLEKNPFSRELLYVLASVRNKGYFRAEVEYANLPNDVILTECLRQSIDEVFHNTPEYQHRVYCALKDYTFARNVYREQGSLLRYNDPEASAEYYRKALDFNSAERIYRDLAERAFENGDDNAAAEYYRKALDFETADHIADKRAQHIHNQSVYQAYSAEIGDKRTYLRHRLEEDCPDKMDELHALQKTIKEHPAGKGWPCTIAFLVSFVISLIMNFIGEKIEIYLIVAFSVVFTFGVKFAKSEKWRIVSTLLTLIGIFLFTVFLTSAYDIFSVLPLFQKLPNCFMLNIFAFVFAALHLYLQLRGSIGQKALKRKKELCSVLNKKSDVIKHELLQRYSESVDEKVVRTWIHELFPYTY